MKVEIRVETYVQGKLMKPGEVADLPDGLAQALLRTGRAILPGAKEPKRKKREKAVKDTGEKAVTE